MLKRWRKYVFAAYALTGALFHLYTGAFGSLAPPTQRGIHVFFVIPLCFLLTGSKLKFLEKRQRAEDAFSAVLMALSSISFGWYVFNWERIYATSAVTTADRIMGIIAIVVVLEAVRRTVGRFITGLIATFLLYAFIGPYIPYRFLAHQGYDLDSIINLVYFGTEGIYGVPVGVCATFIVLIVLLGGFLNVTGGAELFMQLSKSIAGTSRGGPAKIAVIASAFMGTISGATVANVATTGSVTIPMMKKMGYEPEYAGAVEALASSGGQIMPPIMGAAAFIMVEFIMIPYIILCLHATIPAVLYFFSVLMMIHFHSCRLGMMGIPREECPKFFQELKKGGHMLVPMAVLVYLLAIWIGPMLAVFCSIASLWIVSSIRKHTRLNPSRFINGIYMGMRAMAPLTAICAGAGILIGVLSMTGLGMRMAFLIELLSHGHLLAALLLTMVACIVLGMGLPTVAAYVVVAVIVPPTLRNMGVGDLAAHMFIFYFAILAAITPPVATGAYTAAGIAGCNPMGVAAKAVKLGTVAFLLPYAFVYEPSLLLQGEPWRIALHVFFTACGILAWAGAMEQYYFREISFIFRTVLGASAIMLIWPEVWISIVGLAIMLFMTALTVRSNRKEKQLVSAPTH